MNSFIKWCILLTLIGSWEIALGQQERRELDSLIRSNFVVFREVANKQKNINTLKTDQIIIWHALTVMTGTEGGMLNYASVEPFELDDVQRWEDWYNKDPDIKEFIIVIKVLEKIYSGDYSEAYLDFIEGIESKNKKKYEQR